MAPGRPDPSRTDADEAAREAENAAFRWFDDRTPLDASPDDATLVQPAPGLEADQTLVESRSTIYQEHLTRMEAFEVYEEDATRIEEGSGPPDVFDDATRIEYFEAIDPGGTQTEEAETPAPGQSKARRDLRFVELAAENIASQFDKSDAPKVISLPRRQAIEILTRAARLRPSNTILLHQAVRLRLDRNVRDEETAGLLGEYCRRRASDLAARTDLADLLHELGQGREGALLDLDLVASSTGLDASVRERLLFRAAMNLTGRRVWLHPSADRIFEEAAREDAPPGLVCAAAEMLESSWQTHPRRRMILERAAAIRPHDPRLKLMALECAAIDGDCSRALRPALAALTDPDLAPYATRTLRAVAASIRQSEANAIPRELVVEAARNDECLPRDAVPALARLLIVVGHASPAEVRLFQKACDMEPEDDEFRRALAACSRADRRRAADFLDDELKTGEVEAPDFVTPQEFHPPPLFRNLAKAAKGRYEVRNSLGRGAMGEVILALDRELDELVVLKIMPRDAQSDEDALAAFKNEARTARRLSHPNIVRIHDISEVQGLRTISMEYIAGGDLASHLARKGGTLPVDQAVMIIRQVARALAYAHNQGILHLDVKPANVLMETEQRVKLSDFGLASIMAKPLLPANASQHSPAGTPIYMSPEQFDDRELTPASDIYSLGVLFYELLVGNPPFTTGALAYHHEFTPVPSLPESIPASVRLVVDKCLNKRPNHRYRRAEELLRDLDGYDDLRTERR